MKMSLGNITRRRTRILNTRIHYDIRLYIAGRIISKYRGIKKIPSYICIIASSQDIRLYIKIIIVMHADMYLYNIIAT